MECDACLKATAQFGPSVRVCCHDEFVMTAVPWLTDGELHHRDLLVLVNKNTALRFGIVQKSDKHHLCLASNFVHFRGLCR